VFEHAVFSVRQGRIAADGEGVIVAYDYAKKAKAEVPPSWVVAMDTLEGRPVPFVDEP
jgi:acyl-CoA thioesterase FadM